MFCYRSIMDPHHPRHIQHKGRAAVSNRSGRFEPHVRMDVDDGWNTIDEELPPLKTEVTVDSSRSIIARNTSPDLPFDRSINPYRGCEHGCIYCFARPSHAWLGLSPGLDFETRLLMKPDAASLLRRHFSRSGYRPRVISLGSNTDPYQPVERRYRITRQILEVLWEYQHPCAIVTKSGLVARDADILAPMARMNLARVWVSVTTLDRDLARRMEPRAATPARRLATIGTLARAGVPTGVMFAPVIPGLNDHELESCLQAAAEAGATSASHSLLRLPLEIADLFREWLDANYPDRAKRVMTLIRSCRGGRDNDSHWGQRMTGTGPIADLISARFAMARRRFALDHYSWDLDTSKFTRPEAHEPQFCLV